MKKHSLNKKSNKQIFSVFGVGFLMPSITQAVPLMPFPTNFELSSLSNGTGEAGLVINGELANDFSGRSVSQAGDINGDGFNDFIIGAPGADPNGQSTAGASYVVFGKATPFNAVLALNSLNGSNGFQINGELANDFLGGGTGRRSRCRR